MTRLRLNIGTENTLSMGLVFMIGQFYAKMYAMTLNHTVAYPLLDHTQFLISMARLTIEMLGK